MRPTPFDQLKGKFCFLEKMGTEITLDMDPAVVTTSGSVPQINDFKKHFKWKENPTPLETIVMKIKNSAFEKLYRDAFGKWKENEKYLTGLRIHHGATEDFAQELRFSPVYLKLMGDTFIVTELEEHKYDPIKEEFVKSNDAGLDTDYRSKICIDTTGIGTCANFNSGYDAESVTYPFQTIYTMILDSSNPDNAILDDYKKEYVTVTNALWKDKENRLSIKHSFLLMAVSIIDKETDGFLSFDGNYANRSHLCPPCAKIEKNEFPLHNSL